jgi:hypothetical protein
VRLPVLLAAAAALGLPAEPLVRTYDRPPFGPRDPKSITRAERERRKAKKKAAKEARRRNR